MFAARRSLPFIVPAITGAMVSAVVVEVLNPDNWGRRGWIEVTAVLGVVGAFCYFTFTMFRRARAMGSQEERMGMRGPVWVVLIILAVCVGVGVVVFTAMDVGRIQR